MFNVDEDYNPEYTLDVAGYTIWHKLHIAHLICDESKVALLETLLIRLRVPEHIREYFGLKRVLLEDEAATTKYLLDKLFDWYYRGDRASPVHEDEQRRLKMMDLYQAMKDDGVVELIDEE
ncbi:uncharacterized protein EV422DRAFT_565678 [Fimicolochytrium jonesii]|uniref:uncharacterized protein n=1 Tax=Fimicolochytrium jonesii TaxID=1396493 RepID=UPI0022FEA221|nr:uncharacterized protein EV422DRAFT_565678 [Fimicolochytrium jonesii]KAI8823762.1 hypothetical protein EV422DRAFT_565678 [Fimicolochytrium jonesii]